MKHMGISVVVVFSVLAMSSNSHAKGKNLGLENHYFGEKPPGLMPKLMLCLRYVPLP